MTCDMSKLGQNADLIATDSGDVETSHCCSDINIIMSTSQVRP